MPSTYHCQYHLESELNDYQTLLKRISTFLFAISLPKHGKSYPVIYKFLYFTVPLPDIYHFFTMSRQKPSRHRQCFPFTVSLLLIYHFFIFLEQNSYLY